MNVHPDADAKRRAQIDALRSRRPEWLPSNTYRRMDPFDAYYWFLTAVAGRA